MDETQKHLFVVILAGGGGTRLWPLSREESPKQFLKLFNGKSLYQLTLDRAKALTKPEKIIVTTSFKYAGLIRKMSPGIPAENIIAEPVRKDTAIAQGLGALYAFHQDPQAVIVNLASDQLVGPESAFVRDMKSAARLAFEQNKFVTIGIKPTFPHTGLGYIKVTAGNIGEEFVEKPELDKADKYVKSGKYLWNANLYVWKASLILDLLKKYSPKTVVNFPKILKSLGTDKENEMIRFAFQMAPKISIDYAVSEKLKKFLCIQATFNWTDIGNWEEIYKNFTKDSSGNAIYATRGKGQYLGVNAENNLMVLDKQLVVTVGVSNLLVVDTPDAILICNKNDNQAVKQVVEMLKEQKLTKYL